MKTRLIITSILTYTVLWMGSCQSDVAPGDKSIYPENARLVRILQYINLQDHEPSSVTEYEYNVRGQLVKVIHPIYEKGTAKGIGQYEEYVYNNQDQLSKIISYTLHQDGGFVNLKNTLYTYGSKGLIEKEIFEHPTINTYEYNLFYYDQEERLIRTEHYNAKNQLATYQEFVYNAEGVIEEEKTYGANQQLFKINKNRYEKGHNTQTDVYTADENEEIPLRRIIRTFDSNRNLISLESKELSQYSSATSFKLRYEYQK